jgi:UDP:flavonoid glycosyltransferase YjiC (YdhE family)
MRVFLSTSGSRGDVKPMMGLAAVQLRTLDTDVRI